MHGSPAARFMRILIVVLLAAGALTSSRGSLSSATAATGDGIDLFAPATLRANGAELRWSKYTGPSGAAFDRYEIHRSEAAGFVPSSTTLLSVVRDVGVTSFTDTTAAPSKAFSYKVIANASPSDEQRVTLPAEGTAVVEVQPSPQDGKATYIEKASSGTVSCATNGARSRLKVGASTWVDRPMVQFDVTDVPASATISSATLQLYRPAAAPKAVSVDAHRVRGQWVEGDGASACTGAGASWDETEGGVAWDAKGGDIDAAAAGSVDHAAGAAAGWDSFDVRTAAQTWASGGAPNLGLLLKARDESPAAGNAFEYVADDETANPSQRPKLKIVFSDGTKSKGPSVDVSAPEDGSQMSGTTTIAASAGDDRRVAQVQFFVDGAAVGTDTTAPYAVSWNSATVTNAPHSLTAKATDDVGNVTTSPAISVTVGNSAPPTTKITSTSTSYPDVVRGSGAYAHWRLGEATGTTFADSSGRGNNGTFSGTLQRGTAGLLTGDADKSTRFLKAAPSGTGTVGSLAGQSSQYVTAEAWVDYAGTGAIGQVSRIASRGWGSAGGWQLAVVKAGDNTLRAVWSVNVAGTVKEVTAQVAPGKHHLVGRFTGSSVGLFVDGVYAYGVSTAAQALNTTNSVVLGGSLNEDITIDDVALYGKSLVTADASTHYDVGMGRTPTLTATSVVTADAADDRAVDRVDFFVDGSRFATDTTSPYSASLNTLDANDPVYDGTHTITSKATDSHGQERESTTSAVTVGNSAGSGYRAEITAPDAPEEITYDPAATTQDDAGLNVTVKNTSANTWAAGDIVLRPRWVSSDATPEYIEQPEVSLATAVAPNQALTKTVKFKAPTLPAGTEQAQYTLRVDLLSKSTNTFYAQKGNKPWEKPMKVKDAASSDQLGLERFYSYEGE